MLMKVIQTEAVDDGQNYVPADGMVMIIVRPGYEQTARDSLRRRGIGAWWPNYKKEVQAKDGTTGKRYSRLVLTGILPGIILSPSRLNSHFWASIDLAPGAVNVVRKLNGDELVIDDVDVVLMHKIEAGLNRPAEEKVVHSFEAGDDVVFTDHAMSRLSAKVTKVCQDGHVMVDVTIFGAVRSVPVLPHQIAPA
jgi:transcription antitermination factor NusG